MGISYHKSLMKYQQLFCNSEAQDQSGGVQVSYWGTNSLVITDGISTFLVDPFFTRPGVMAFIRRLQADEGLVRHYLSEAGVERADAVLLTHAHYDHALDAAFAAIHTSAQFVGSHSAVMVGRGGGVSEGRLTVVESMDTVNAGNFVITFIRSSHVPLPYPLSAFSGIKESIDAPLVSPAYLWDYKAGEAFTLHITHREGNLLITGSAGWSPGGLTGWRADVAILAAGGLAWMGESYMRSYFHNTVAAVGAQQVLITHWDNFTLPLEVPLRFLGVRPNKLDLLAALVHEYGDCRLQLMPVGQKVSLFGMKRDD